MSIEGAVDQPRPFGLVSGMHVSDLIQMARGLQQDAYHQRADLFLLNANFTTTLFQINLDEAMKHDPKFDLVLKANDRLTVYHTADVVWLGNRIVTAVGALRQPGTYVRADGMRLKDLILQSHNLTADAYAPVAWVQRTNPDGTPGPLFRVDLRKVLAEDPENNIVLHDLDQLTVETVQQAVMQPNQTVSIDGSVQSPSTYPRSLHMTLRDLIGMAGGPTLDASPHVSLQRTDLNGLPGKIYSLDWGRISRGEPDQNLEVDPRDHVHVFSIHEWEFIPDYSVTIAGAVQNPNTFTMYKDMTTRDLIQLAGGPLPDANTGRAFLQRVNLDGTQGPVFIIDIGGALAGNSKDNFPLHPHDLLSVYTKAQGEFLMPETVTINGDVQNPGTFPRSTNMTLRDLLWLAGGPYPTVADELEIGHIYQPRGTPLMRARIADVMANGPAGHILLQKGDIVDVPTNGLIELHPRVVVLAGEVKFPGPYMITGKGDHLSELIRRAGGLTDRSFAEGTQFARNPALLQTPVQVAEHPQIEAMLQQVSADEYSRTLAAVDMDKLRLVFSAGGNRRRCRAEPHPAVGSKPGDNEHADVYAGNVNGPSGRGDAYSNDGDPGPRARTEPADAFRQPERRRGCRHTPPRLTRGHRRRGWRRDHGAHYAQHGQHSWRSSYPECNAVRPRQGAGLLRAAGGRVYDRCRPARRDRRSRFRRHRQVPSRSAAQARRQRPDSDQGAVSAL